MTNESRLSLYLYDFLDVLYIRPPPTPRPYPLHPAIKIASGESWLNPGPWGRG